MRKQFIVMVLVLVLAAFACRMGEDVAQRPGPTIPVTTEEAQRFEENLKTTADSFSQSGEFDLEITEEQLTSYVYYETQKQPEIGVTDPQIYLRDGKILMYAKYAESIVPVNVELVITPLVSDGKVKLQLDSVKLGPASAPDALVEQFQRIITEQVEPSLNESFAGELYVETLSISDGVLKLHGKKP